MIKDAKIYSDGSHFIAIPYVPNKRLRKPRVPEEKITVVDVLDSEQNKEITPAIDEQEQIVENESEQNPMSDESIFVQINETDVINKDTGELIDIHKIPKTKKAKVERKSTRADEFNKLYLKYSDLKKDKRKDAILRSMTPLFRLQSDAEAYVDKKLEDKERSLIARKIRFIRKANLNDFNYFVTFTYDDKKHDEASFRKKLCRTLRNFHDRKDWLYMGVWERSSKRKQRLHFHGLFKIPEGTMPGNLVQVCDYSTVTHKMQETIQNTFFNKKFGRSDFKEIIPAENRLGNAMAYILKYITKTDEKIVYSRGIPMFLKSDIDNNDVITRIGLEDKKLLLFDNFKCYKDGKFIGHMSPQIKKQMDKANS